MQTLVTGCAGFIGSHLCERLLRAGHRVVGVDALTTYYDPDLKVGNLSICRGSAEFEFWHRPIAEMPISLVQDADWIFHLAGRPSVGTSWESEFSSYVAHNVVETQRLLEWARGSTRLQRLVYASSSSVYGNSPAALATEESPTAPFSPYGVTKLAAEHLCAAYADNFGVPTVALRLFTVCGPRQRPDMMLSRLIFAGMSGGTFTLYGDGRVVRDFTCVADVVEGMILAAERPLRHRIFNISGGRLASVAEVIQIVEKTLGTKIALQRTSGQRGDVARTAADLRRARTELGYSPAWQLEDTIRAQIEHASLSRQGLADAGGNLKAPRS